MQTAQERPETLRYSRQEGKTARLSSEHWHSAGSPVLRHAHALDLSVRTPQSSGVHRGRGPLLGRWAWELLAIAAATPRRRRAEAAVGGGRTMGDCRKAACKPKRLG